MTPSRCTTCGEPIPARATPGRPRRYCSGRCRTEAYRQRQAAAFEAEQIGPQPNPLEYVRAELLAVADTIATNNAAAPVEDQLARAIIETRTLAGSFRRLEPRLPNGLGWRAGEASKRLERVVADLFPQPKEHNNEQ